MLAKIFFFILVLQAGLLTVDFTIKFKLSYKQKYKSLIPETTVL